LNELNSSCLTGTGSGLGSSRLNLRFSFGFICSGLISKEIVFLGL
jgi:hypothetical protein